MILYQQDPWDEASNMKVCKNCWEIYNNKHFEKCPYCNPILVVEKWNCDCDKSNFPPNYVGKCLVCREKPDLKEVSYV